MRIENSITRVTVLHHKASQVMPDSYPEWQNFQFASNNHYGFFFLHTFPSAIAFKLEYALFYQFNAKITVFFIKKCSVWLLFKTLMSKGSVENDFKNWCLDVKNWRHDVKKTTWSHAQESSYTLSCKMTFPSPSRVHGNSGRVCKKLASGILVTCQVNASYYGNFDSISSVVSGIRLTLMTFDPQKKEVPRFNRCRQHRLVLLSIMPLRSQLLWKLKILLQQLCMICKERLI